jgi:hypothetical protein
MTIEITLLIAIAGVVFGAFGVYTGAASRKRNEKADIQKDTEKHTIIMQKLESISNSLIEIKVTRENDHTEQLNMRDRILTLENRMEVLEMKNIHTQKRRVTDENIQT